MRALTRTRCFSTVRALAHENPLGLPRSGTPPKWGSRLPKQRRIAHVGKVVAVSSAKGGVGKSTIAANLAISFARLGYKAGILDTDIFGPSIPTLFNLAGEPRLSPDNQLVPLTNYGVETMSMGYLVGESDPVVWRGMMVMKAVQQLLHEVAWGHLDILVLDLPPGTGDTQLTIAQQVELDGAVIVTTPHTLAIKDAIKGVSMFRKTNVPILGAVQNMSSYVCPHCAHAHSLFGDEQEDDHQDHPQNQQNQQNQRQPEQEQQQKNHPGAPLVSWLPPDQKIQLLADIPLHRNIGFSYSQRAQRGQLGIISQQPQAEAASPTAIFRQLAQNIGQQIGLSKLD